jgi:hypothetical protein
MLYAITGKMYRNDNIYQMSVAATSCCSLPRSRVAGRRGALMSSYARRFDGGHHLRAHT